MSECTLFKEKENIKEPWQTFVQPNCGNCQKWNEIKCKEEWRFKMKKYIGFKMIEAEHMTAKEAGEVLQRSIDTSNADAEGNGYLVKYPDGYTSWSPKAQFEKAYLQVGDNNTIVEQNVNDFVKEIEYQKWGDKTTVAKATLANGFIIVESSSCVDPANFNMDIGGEICKERIYNEVWKMLGFLLQSAKYGIKG